MIDQYTLKTVRKVKALYDAYRRYLYKPVADLSCEISEISAPDEAPASRAKISTQMPESGWHSISPGEAWGGEFCYAWFRTSYTIPEELAGRTVLLRSFLGAAEELLFINGMPSGLFDVCTEISGNSPRLHEVQPLTFSARPGERFEITVECYAGHTVPGTMPYEDVDHNGASFYPRNTVRPYNGLQITVCDPEVADFLLHHSIVCQMSETADETSQEYADAINALRCIYPVLPQHPWEQSGDWHEAIKKATNILKALTGKRSEGAESGRIGYVGMIGHSHLDTAWQWPVRETVHKAARTFSNALRLMEHYPDYHFMQSSVLYLEWMRLYYPPLFEKIKERIAEGRWEPNGGVWVECDDNIPGGEYMIRQFVRGQHYTKNNFNYVADCFWQPDTFGYSAALPQILKGCEIRYFLTTKLSWNEANKFPHDSFIWKGIDGTEILTHFNITHCAPDVKSIRRDALGSIRHRDVTDMKLMSYGYGDGGGGPSYSMQETERIVNEMAGMPTLENTTVSKFMQRMESTARNLPVFSGELYLELHRGTLTQLHDIKCSNRMLENSIRNLEIISAISGEKKPGVLESALDTLLLNQFHDILPGTCLAEAHDVAIYQNYAAAAELNKLSAGILGAQKDCKQLVLCNTLSWERDGQIVADDRGFDPDGCTVQRYDDCNGNRKIAFSGISLSPFSVSSVSAGTARNAKCPFTADDAHITTPFAEITLNKNGEIISYLTKSGFEVVRTPEKPLNTIYIGEDIPEVWDNWDIDYDQSSKLHLVTAATAEIVSVGALQLRYRISRKLTDRSVMIQDMVFYSDTPRIDFETTVDWNESHTLLKAGFDVNVQADTARFETQFGYVKRPTHENYGTDKAQFEVCNHKWTDLSDNRFGVAILNNCKYGISVAGGDMRLTLHKGGCRPDPRGDHGRHSFTYSLLVHECGFSTVPVIHPAYELNVPVVVTAGAAKAEDNKPLFTVNTDHVILETVKYSEDNSGFTVRLYETEGSHADCILTTGLSAEKAEETNMLEWNGVSLPFTGNSVALKFRPFEIKTIKFS